MFYRSFLRIRKRPKISLSGAGFRSKPGLTLVEIMVTVVVLSLGILLVYQGFLSSLGGFTYCMDYLTAQLWIDEKIWDIQDKLSHYKTLLTEDASGGFTVRNKEFNWALSYNLIEGLRNASLYEIGLGVSWREGLKQVGTRRGLYVLYIEK